MPTDTEPAEHSPLWTTVPEMGVGILSFLHFALVAVVVVQVLRGKMTVPNGVFGLIVLLFLPVLGPLLVLTWQRRLNRSRANRS